MSRSVLIVDDEAHIRALLEQTLEELEDEGVELMTAADGEAALALIAAERPDLVFLDVMMPRMNGYEVCRAFRQDTLFKGLPIIAQSGWGQSKDKTLASEAGFDHHLTKPVALEELQQVLATLAL